MKWLYFSLCVHITAWNVMAAKTDFPTASFMMAMGADVGFDQYHESEQDDLKGGPVTTKMINGTTEGLIIIGGLKRKIVVQFSPR